jgi:hypothetical protein
MAIAPDSFDAAGFALPVEATQGSAMPSERWLAMAIQSLQDNPPPSVVWLTEPGEGMVLNPYRGWTREEVATVLEPVTIEGEVDADTMDAVWGRGYGMLLQQELVATYPTDLMDPEPTYTGGWGRESINHCNCDYCRALRGEMASRVAGSRWLNQQVLQDAIDKAEERAMSLLAELITPQQLQSYRDFQHFDVTVRSGNSYRIYRGRDSNVYRLTPQGNQDQRYCLTLAGSSNMPVTDHVIAQYLTLCGDEDDFLRQANLIEYRNRRATLGEYIANGFPVRIPPAPAQDEAGPNE